MKRHKSTNSLKTLSTFTANGLIAAPKHLKEEMKQLWKSQIKKTSYRFVYAASTQTDVSPWLQTTNKPVCSLVMSYSIHTDYKQTLWRHISFHRSCTHKTSGSPNPDYLTHSLGFDSSQLIYIQRAPTLRRSTELTPDPIPILHAGMYMFLHIL